MNEQPGSPLVSQINDALSSMAGIKGDDHIGMTHIDQLVSELRSGKTIEEIMTDFKRDKEAGPLPWTKSAIESMKKAYSESEADYIEAIISHDKTGK